MRILFFLSIFLSIGFEVTAQNVVEVNVSRNIGYHDEAGNYTLYLGHNNKDGWIIADTAGAVLILWKFYRKKKENWWFWDMHYRAFMIRENPRKKYQFKKLFLQYLKAYK